MPSLADLLRNDPWGAPPQTPLAKTVTDVGFDPSLGFAGAVQTYLSRLKQMQGGLAQDMLDTAADPNAEGIQRAANLLGGLGLKIANVPMALMPSAQELRDRGYQSGASPEMQAVGGALGDMVNIPEPASVGTLLAGLGKAAVGAKGLAGAAAMAGKSAAVAPLGKALEQAAQDGIIAYHGSPHSFDKFDMSKIGTGEGAQAYGPGLYFAGNEKVARSYRDELSRRHGLETYSIGGNPEGEYDLSARLSNEFNIPQGTVKQFISAAGQGKLDYYRSSKNEGRLNDLIDYLDKSGIKRDRPDGVPLGNMYQVHLNVSPAQIATYDEAKNGHDAYSFALKAKEDGMKGIRYKDAVSRGRDGGTYNYVIFDDSIISILKKYGIPMTAGAGGMLVTGANMPPDIAAQLQQQ